MPNLSRYVVALVLIITSPSFAEKNQESPGNRLYEQGLTFASAGLHRNAWVACERAWNTEQLVSAATCAANAMFQLGDDFRAIHFLGAVVEYLETQEATKSREYHEAKRTLMLMKGVKFRAANAPSVAIGSGRYSTWVGPDGVEREGLIYPLAITNTAQHDGQITASHFEHDRIPGFIVLESHLIAAGQILRGVIRIPRWGIPADFASLTKAPSITVKIKTAAGLHPTTIAMGLMELRIREPPDPRLRHTVVSVRGVFGLFAIPQRALSPTERAQWVDNKGVGVRFQKGFGWRMAFEGDLAIGQTSDADFIDGGNRRAIHGRALGSFVGRTGSDYVASVRLGIGLQVTKYSADSEDMRGFDLDPIGLLGVAIERRFRNAVIGLRGDFLNGLQSRIQLAEIGLSVGYGF